jgi:hypothetical protein
MERSDGYSEKYLAYLEGIGKGIGPYSASSLCFMIYTSFDGSGGTTIILVSWPVTLRNRK